MLDPDSTDTPVDDHAASEILKRAGFPFEPSTLKKLRSTGGGPKFLKNGNRVRYRPSALAAWLESRTRECANTTEATMLKSAA